MLGNYPIEVTGRIDSGAAEAAIAMAANRTGQTLAEVIMGMIFRAAEGPQAAGTTTARARGRRRRPATTPAAELGTSAAGHDLEASLAAAVAAGEPALFADSILGLDGARVTGPPAKRSCGVRRTRLRHRTQLATANPAASADAAHADASDQAQYQPSSRSCPGSVDECEKVADEKVGEREKVGIGSVNESEKVGEKVVRTIAACETPNAVTALGGLLSAAVTGEME